MGGISELPQLNYSQLRTQGWNVASPALNDIMNGSAILKRGDAGDAVRDMQLRLMELGYDLGSYGADGKFGAVTETALKDFQTRNANLIQTDGSFKADDGRFGSSTFAPLFGTVTDPKGNILTPAYGALRSGPNDNYNSSRLSPAEQQRIAMFSQWTGDAQYTIDPKLQNAVANNRAAALASQYRPNVNPANVNPANVNPANVNPANVNPANVNPANVNPANVNPANVNPANVNPANVSYRTSTTAIAKPNTDSDIVGGDLTAFQWNRRPDAYFGTGSNATIRDYRGQVVTRNADVAAMGVEGDANIVGGSLRVGNANNLGADGRLSVDVSGRLGGYVASSYNKTTGEGSISGAGGAYIGADASKEWNIGLRYFGFGAKASVGVGAGGEASGYASTENRRLSVGGFARGGLGITGGGGGQAWFDWGKVADDASWVGNKIAGAWNSIGWSTAQSSTFK